jgi:hypothetical protein
MEDRNLTTAQIQNYSEFLIREEKSNATCKKYLRDVNSFRIFANKTPVSKELVVAWKKADRTGVCSTFYQFYASISQQPLRILRLA